MSRGGSTLVGDDFRRFETELASLEKKEPTLTDKACLAELLRELIYRSVKLIAELLGLPAKLPGESEARDTVLDETRRVAEVLAECLWLSNAAQLVRDDECCERLRIKKQDRLETRTLADWDGTGPSRLFVVNLLGTSFILDRLFKKAKLCYLLPLLFPEELLLRPVLRTPNAAQPTYWIVRRGSWRPDTARRCTGPRCQSATGDKKGMLHAGCVERCRLGCDPEWLSSDTTEVWVKSEPLDAAALPGMAGAGGEAPDFGLELDDAIRIALHHPLASAEALGRFLDGIFRVSGRLWTEQIGEWARKQRLKPAAALLTELEALRVQARGG